MRCFSGMPWFLLFSLIFVTKVLSEVTFFELPEHINQPYWEAITRDALKRELKKWSDIEKKFTYFAYPFHDIIMGKTSLDTFEKQLRNVRLENGVTTIYFFPDGPMLESYLIPILKILKRTGIQHVFTPSAPREKQIIGLNIVAMPFPSRIIASNPVKDILVSFVGTISSSPARQAIGFLPLIDGFYIKINDKCFADMTISERELLIKPYDNVLARSRFSLSPRGCEPGSFRFWESLWCGAIPILIADNYRLPEIFDWEKCVIFLSEKDFQANPAVVVDLIKRFSQKCEHEMRQACYEATKLSSGDNHVDAFRFYFAK